MKSHEYQFCARDLGAVLGPLLLVAASVIALIHVAQGARQLPVPPISINPDLTMLMHQARASHRPDPAQIVLVGDSTCLMGVDARQLSRSLPNQPPVLSLALIIGLDLRTYGRVLTNFVAANPGGQVRTVVMLLTPQKLASGSPGVQETMAWQQLDPAADSREPAAASDSRPDWLAHKVLRENLVAQVLDTPLRGSGAEYFGFASQIDRYMTDHRGSLRDFGTFLLPRQRQHLVYQLAPGFEPESRAFRSLVPAGVQLIIGLTPGPRSAAAPTDRTRRNELLQHWNQWLQADALLTGLPTTLPDAGFSLSGHLNAQGQGEFTEILARELAPLLRWGGSPQN